MARHRRKAVESLGQNKIKRALEAGESLEGLTGFFHVEELGVYVPLTVRGVSISDDECGIKLRCEVKGGIGEALLSPCQVIDDKAAVLEAEGRAKKLAVAEDDKSKLLSHSLITVRRQQLADYIQMELDQESQVTITNDIEARAIPITKMPQAVLQEYVAAAIELKHGIKLDTRYY